MEIICVICLKRAATFHTSLSVLDTCSVSGQLRLHIEIHICKVVMHMLTVDFINWAIVLYAIVTP